MNRFLSAQERAVFQRRARVWRGAEAVRCRFWIGVCRRHGLPAPCAISEELSLISLFCALHSVFHTRMPPGEQTRACFFKVIAFNCIANDACSLFIIHAENFLCICKPSCWTSCKA